MDYDQIIEIFEDPNMFDNDIWDKIEYIQSKTDKYSTTELLNIYDEEN